MNQNELEQVVKYQRQSLTYLEKWLSEEIEKDKLEERKCKFCGQPADKDALDENGINIEICDNCDNKSKENL